MIFDLAQNLDFYQNLGVNERYKKAVEFLKNTDLKSLSVGEYPIDGDDVFAAVSQYTTIPMEEAKFETHQVYTDIQYMIEGTEIMSYAPAEQLNITMPYNSEKDVAIYDNAHMGLQVVVSAGQFMIFNPWDAHKPKAAHIQPSPVKKIIIKIKEI